MAGGLALIAERRFSYEPLITHRLGLDEATPVSPFSSGDRGFIKSVVMP